MLCQSFTTVNENEMKWSHKRKTLQLWARECSI
jgi:hypothetical protein